MNAHYDANVKVSPEQMQLLQQKMSEQFSIKGFELGSMGGYYTYEQVASELDSKSFLYPHISRVGVEKPTS
jgi:hypothetical protein